MCDGLTVSQYHGNFGIDRRSTKSSYKDVRWSMVMGGKLCHEQFTSVLFTHTTNQRTLLRGQLSHVFFNLNN